MHLLLHNHSKYVCLQCIGYGLGSAGTGSGTIIQVIQILRALRYGLKTPVVWLTLIHADLLHGPLNAYT